MIKLSWNETKKGANPEISLRSRSAVILIFTRVTGLIVNPYSNFNIGRVVILFGKEKEQP